MELGACHQCAGRATVCRMRICDYKFAVYGFFAEHSGKGGTRLRDSMADISEPGLIALRALQNQESIVAA